MKGGRPLWFLLAILGGWSVIRGIALYREHPDAVLRRPVKRIVAALGATSARATPLALALVAVPSRVRHAVVPPPRLWPREARVPAVVAPPPRPVAMDAAVAIRPVAPRTPVAAGLPVVTLTPAPAPGRSRFAGSAWLIARDGGTSDVPGSQLGGSQVGARVTYAVSRDRRLAVSARLSAPLAAPGREAAVGLDWQPTRAPVHMIVERRFALDGGAGGTMAGVIGGFGPQEVIAGVRLEGYAQAGVIARGRVDGFADGALRATYPLVAIGRLRVDAGGGVWGGVQRGAGRLDIGPSLGLIVPFGPRALRLAADWRQRIAGPSRPGSGPALTIGTDF